MTNLVGSRNPGIDMLRALSALAVFLYYFRLGWLGVQVFFVISGYLITQSIESRPRLGLQAVALLRRQPRPDPAR